MEETNCFVIVCCNTKLSVFKTGKTKNDPNHILESVQIVLPKESRKKKIYQKDIIF